MADALSLAWALALGGVLGTFFVGGLWWTVQRGLASAHPAAWFLVSWLVRMGGTAAGIAAVSGGKWQRLLACLAGFVVAGALVKRWTGPRPDAPDPRGTEAAHAPVAR